MGEEKGSCQQSAVKRKGRDTDTVIGPFFVSQTNVGTASKATWGKLLRHGMECILVFPSA